MLCIYTAACKIKEVGNACLVYGIVAQARNQGVVGGSSPTPEKFLAP